MHHGPWVFRTIARRGPTAGTFGDGAFVVDTERGAFGDGASNTSVRTGGHTGRPYGPASGFLVGAACMAARTGSRFSRGSMVPPRRGRCPHRPATPPGSGHSADRMHLRPHCRGGFYIRPEPAASTTGPGYFAPGSGAPTVHPSIWSVGRGAHTPPNRPAGTTGLAGRAARLWRHVGMPPYRISFNRFPRCFDKTAAANKQSAYGRQLLLYYGTCYRSSRK